MGSAIRGCSYDTERTREKIKNRYNTDDSGRSYDGMQSTCGGSMAGWKAKEVVLRHSDCCFLAACDRASGKADLVLKMIQDITTILC